MNRRQLLLSQSCHVIEFSIECDWLECSSLRLFDLSWEVVFDVWITTWAKLDGERTSRISPAKVRQNPTEALRRRLEDAGFITYFDGDDESIQSLKMHVPVVNRAYLADLMQSMKEIAVADPDLFSVPIDELE